MATELAKAYVQIVPSARGISGSIGKVLDPEMRSAGESAGGTLGGKLVGKLKGIVAAAGIGKAIGAAISEGAELEQSIGGIETLFKDSYSKVEKYANEAYKTTGLSANAYMQQATSFSASLLQSLGGDTDKAADAANQALIDMSDNANKMGTDMQSIQDAYQGFAKQNYTMLDNLKLGYGGTKTEMERLLADATKISGVKYDISNLSDVYSAIHVIQEDLDITGTTAKESASTFSGSFASMKGAVSNFLATLALGEKGTMSLNQAMSNMLSSAVTFIFNNALPMLLNIVTSLPDAIFSALEMVGSANLGDFVSKAFGWLAEFITQKLPEMVSHGISAIGSFVSGMIDAIPSVIDGATKIIDDFLNNGIGGEGSFGKIVKAGLDLVIKLAESIIKNLPKIVAAGVKLIVHLAKGIAQAVPDLLKKIPEIISNIVSKFSDIFPKIKSVGKNLIKGLWDGIIALKDWIVEKVRSIGKTILSGFKNLLSIDSLKSVGKNLVKGLWNGIGSVKDWVLDKIKGFGKSILDGIKDFFGIGSPSRVMGDEVGVFLGQGIGVGFTDSMKYVRKEMQNAIPRSFDVTPTLKYNYKAGNLGSSAFYVPDTTQEYTINVYADVDGTPLMVKAADYTVKKISRDQKGSMRMRGATI